MKQNINRIDHVVWIAHPDNQERFVAKLSEIFKAEFEGPLIRHDLGNRIWVSWSAGFEVFSPYGEENEHTRKWWDILRRRGEGLFAIVFGVPDIQEAREHVLRLGYKPTGIIEGTGDEIWRDKLLMFKEVIVGEELNTVMAFGQIGYADDVIDVRST